jgi:DNA-binding MarR family transcriptional regulator
MAHLRLVAPPHAPVAAAEVAPRRAALSRSSTIVNVVNDLGIDAPALANRLRPVLLKLNRELRREVHPLGVTGGQVSLLIQIRERPGIGVRELAGREGISPAGMSGHADRLERAGLVRRTPDPQDRRRHGLSLTPAGDDVLRTVTKRRTAWLAARLRRLSAADLQAIDAAVDPLRRLVEDSRA